MLSLMAASSLFFGKSSPVLFDDYFLYSASYYYIKPLPLTHFPHPAYFFAENQKRAGLCLHPVHYPERNDHPAAHLDHVELLQQGPPHADAARPDLLRVCGES